MRILYCIPMLYHSGGMERVLTQKVNWLAAHTSHEFTILTTECMPEGVSDIYFPLNPKIQVAHLNIDFNADYATPLLMKWYGHMRRMRIYKRALAQYIKAHKIDLCISLGGKEIAFLQALPCRTIAELHFAKDQRRQLLESNHVGRIWSLLGKIRTWQLVRAVKPLEQLVVLTEEDRVDWQKAGCKNVICIPNPCSLDGQKLPIPTEQSKTVLAVGRLHEQKGFDLLLRAWKPIEQQHPEWKLRIVGEGPKRKELEEQCAALNLQHACFAGQTRDIVSEYCNASLFVLSSRFEGLPLALIEAMWCGLPCISFDCPHGPSVLLADNKGWLVSNGDISALGRQIEYAIAHLDEAKERAHNAQAYTHNAFGEDIIMSQWVQLIEKKKVLLINEALNTGSTGHIVEQIGLSAQNLGYSCLVAHGARYVHTSQLPHISFSSIVEEYVHGGLSLFFNAHGLGSRWATKRLIRSIKQYRPSLIHIHNIHGYFLHYPTLFAFLKSQSASIIWTLHDCWTMTGRCAYFTAHDCNQWQNVCKRCPSYCDYPRSIIHCGTETNFLLKKENFTRVDNLTLVPVSKWLEGIVQRSFLSHYPIHTIYNGIEIHLFKPKKSSLRAQWGAENKVVILGVASQWTETKGWNDWMQLAQQVDDNCQIVLVGVSEKQRRLLPPNCIGIKQIEDREQLAQIYSAADIYVNLAHQEAFGLTLIEAMACGTPCISYRTTAIPEITTPEVCTFVEDGNIQGVLEAIKMYGRHTKKAKTELCRQHVITHFDEKITINKYMNLYAQTIIS